MSNIIILAGSERKDGNTDMLVGLKDKLCQIKSKLIKAILYYITIIMLILDPVYLCLLSGCFGGGDLNGILYLMPQAYVYTIVGGIQAIQFGNIIELEKISDEQG